MTSGVGRVTRGTELVDQMDEASGQTDGASDQIDGASDQTDGASAQAGRARYHNYPASVITVPKHKFSEFLTRFCAFLGLVVICLLNIPSLYFSVLFVYLLA